MEEEGGYPRDWCGLLIDGVGGGPRIKGRRVGEVPKRTRDGGSHRKDNPPF